MLTKLRLMLGIKPKRPSSQIISDHIERTLDELELAIWHNKLALERQKSNLQVLESHRDWLRQQRGAVGQPDCTSQRL